MACRHRVEARRNRWARAALLAALLAAACGDDAEPAPPAPLDGGSGGVGGGDAGHAGDAAGGASPQPVVLLPKASIEPDEIAILVNANDSQSVEVGSYYQQQRQIPAANTIMLDVPVGSMLSEAEFAAVKAELDAAIGPDIQGLVISWTTPYRVECMSVTSAFALGYDDQYCNTGTGGCSATAPVDYFDSDSVRPYTDHGIRPAMALAAAQTDDALDLIDRGIASDGTFPGGDGYFVRTTDAARSVRWSNFMQTVADWDYPEGLELTYVDNASGAGANTIENADNVLFYFTGLADVPGIETNTYRPGAVADHLTSFGGRVPTSGQMSVVRWLEAGVTASYGTVVEPCNFEQKFPNTRVLLPHYYRGQTVLEAYWKSVRWPGEGLFVGEPLARPWGGSIVEFEDGTLTIRTTMLDPAKEYALSEGDSEQGPFATVLAPISVPRHQLATITLPDAQAPFYQLAETGTR